MKKLLFLTLLAAAVVVWAPQAWAGHCVCVDGDDLDTEPDHLACCEEAAPPDPNAPPESLCGAIVVPGAASVAGCVSQETAIDGCLEGEPDGSGSGHACLALGTEPPEDPASVVQAGPGANNTDTDACEACGCLVDTTTACTGGGGGGGGGGLPLPIPPM